MNDRRFRLSPLTCASEAAAVWSLLPIKPSSPSPGNWAVVPFGRGTRFSHSSHHLAAEFSYPENRRWGPPEWRFYSLGRRLYYRGQPWLPSDGTSGIRGRLVTCPDDWSFTEEEPKERPGPAPITAAPAPTPAPAPLRFQIPYRCCLEA